MIRPVQIHFSYEVENFTLEVLRVKAQSLYSIEGIWDKKKYQNQTSDVLGQVFLISLFGFGFFLLEEVWKRG